MSEKKVKIKSKTGQVEVERKKPPIFKYTFNNENSVVEVPAEHAKLILENPMYYEADSTERPTKPEKPKKPEAKKESSFEGPPKEEDK